LGQLWATEADSKEFQRRAQQLIDCYNTFDVKPLETGLKADGAFTVSENVADFGGFFLAYDSYVKYLDKHGFKGEQRRLQMQRFYEACDYLWGGKWTADFALKRTGDAKRPDEQDVHSLFRERVNGVVINMTTGMISSTSKQATNFISLPRNVSGSGKWRVLPSKQSPASSVMPGDGRLV
jgi:predicted metalloendopeptidase